MVLEKLQLEFGIDPVVFVGILPSVICPSFDRDKQTTHSIGIYWHLSAKIRLSFFTPHELFASPTILEERRFFQLDIVNFL